MQEYFYELTDELCGKLRADEVLLAAFSGEQSDFIRFNNSRVRQAGSVAQGYLTIDLICGQRHAKATATLSNDKDVDRERLASALEDLRERLAHVPEDPYLLYSTEVHSGEQHGEDRLPDRAAVLAAILKAGGQRDMVGLHAQGGIFGGFANSLGQRNWFSRHSFHFSWSFYHAGDKAVKSDWAGFEWCEEDFQRKAASAAEQLAVLARPPKTIPPGGYRVYLAPSALEEFVGMLGGGGFSLKAHRTKTTPLLKMIEQGAKLAPGVTILENTREGMAPNFQAQGFIRPDSVTLIERGEYRDCLVSPRSAKEYGAETNGASSGEAPASLDMAAGEVGAEEVLRRLDTGVYVNQTHYLNYSDRPACRITGMTRFATFWVESGRIVAPLNVMRFDETAYRVLGENLIGLTAEREFIPEAGTYGGRSTRSSRLPGALIEDFRFTL